MGLNSCSSVKYISHVISISDFRVLSLLVFILWTLEIINLYDSD